MNRERVQKLRDHLQALADHKVPNVEVGYNQARWYGPAIGSWIDAPDMSTNGCGTVACMAGHTILLFGDEEDIKRLKHDEGELAVRRAGELLGLEHYDAGVLFTARENIYALTRRPISRAISSLDKLLANDA